MDCVVVGTCPAKQQACVPIKGGREYRWIDCRNDRGCGPRGRDPVCITGGGWHRHALRHLVRMCTRRDELRMSSLWCDWIRRWSVTPRIAGCDCFGSRTSFLRMRYSMSAFAAYCRIGSLAEYPTGQS